MSQDYRRKATSVSLIHYLFVWIPKYRRKILTGKVSHRLKYWISKALVRIDCSIVEIEIMPDHVHLLVNTPPTLAPSDIIAFVKGLSSKKLREEFPLLQKLPSLWT